MPGNFIDTNVLIYLASGDAAKADRAEEVVAQGGTISVQVLNEIANVARRKMQLDWSETRTLLSLLRNLLIVVPLDEKTHDTGLALAERYGFSIYDSMIVASALSAGCTQLWSEDMQNGLRIGDRLIITDPFSSARWWLR
jgi:predicted nucleic acid-binding protein